MGSYPVGRGLSTGRWHLSATQEGVSTQGPRGGPSCPRLKPRDSGSPRCLWYPTSHCPCAGAQVTQIHRKGKAMHMSKTEEEEEEEWRRKGKGGEEGKRERGREKERNIQIPPSKENLYEHYRVSSYSFPVNTQYTSTRMALHGKILGPYPNTALELLLSWRHPLLGIMQPHPCGGCLLFHCGCRMIWGVLGVLFCVFF